jgi:hypothetical protein
MKAPSFLAPPAFVSDVGDSAPATGQGGRGNPAHSVGSPRACGEGTRLESEPLDMAHALGRARDLATDLCGNLSQSKGLADELGDAPLGLGSVGASQRDLVRLLGHLGTTPWLPFELRKRNRPRCGVPSRRTGLPCGAPVCWRPDGKRLARTCRMHGGCGGPRTADGWARVREGHSRWRATCEARAVLRAAGRRGALAGHAKRRARGAKP